MQLEVRPGTPLDEVANRRQRDPAQPMQRQLVLLVEREVGEASEPALEHEVAEQIAHEIADRAGAERNQ